MYTTALDFYIAVRGTKSRCSSSVVSQKDATQSHSMRHGIAWSAAPSSFLNSLRWSFAFQIGRHYQHEVPTTLSCLEEA